MTSELRMLCVLASISALTGCGGEDDAAKQDGSGGASTGGGAGSGGTSSGGQGGSAVGGSGGTAGSPSGGGSGGGVGGGGACSVTFADPLGYPKPRCIAIPLPDQASVTNEYWVDMSNGSGSTCSQAAPCASLNNVSGKPGTNGGPANIYLKGSAYLHLTGADLAGSPGSEIVVRPWPNDPTPAIMTAEQGCNVPNANTISGNGTHHVVFDGGPEMLFRFVGSGCTSNQNGYTLVVRSNDITLWRVRVDANQSSGPALGPGVGSGTHIENFRFVNSEIFNAGNYYGVYSGGGTGCTAGDTSHENLEFRNSVFRNIDGRGIQVEPRADSNGLIVDGNAFHDIGYAKSGNMNVSMAVAPAGACGGVTDNVEVSNNIAWDLGGGFARVDYGLSAPEKFVIVNNTVWDYANTTPVELSSHAITATFDGDPAIVRNNLLLAPANGGVNPINRGSGFETSDNLCESGSECGSGELSGTPGAVWLSLDPDSASFLFPQGPALDAAELQPSFEVDYLGATRSNPSDVGAIEQ